MNNQEQAQKIMSLMKHFGVAEVVVCAGARNAPLVVGLEAQSGFKIWRFFEERDAAFFAIGRIKAEGKPVAVVTTSGTAAAELLPATIEAHYSGLPLLLVTADRPVEYRGTGAPQAIEQIGLYSHYVEETFDLQGGESVSPRVSWSKTRPLHLNVCFAEPLLPSAQVEQGQVEAESAGLGPSAARAAQLAESLFGIDDDFDVDEFAVGGKKQASTAVAAAWSQFQSRVDSPLLIVGPLPRSEQERVRRWIKSWPGLVYAEALSGMRGDLSLSEKLVMGGERSLRWAREQRWFDGVVRIGGVPTCRAWRDLETVGRELPVFSLSPSGFAGLSRPEAPVFSLEDLESVEIPAERVDFPTEWVDWSRSRWANSLQLFDQFPEAEPSAFYHLSRLIPARSRVYLGNSLPIREWDLAADEAGKEFWIDGNRGANGIDGQVSSFLGFAQDKGPNWGIFGDLTALYNLSAPWALRERPLEDVKIVVINNGGGRIFSRMFSRPEFENRHQVEFLGWAGLWEMGYLRVDNLAEAELFEPGREIIEVRPSEEQTTDYWAALEKIWAE